MSEGKAPEELLEKGKHTNVKELRERIEASGEELTDEALEEIAGGLTWETNNSCPKGGEHNYVYKHLQPTASAVFELWECTKCGDGYLA